MKAVDSTAANLFTDTPPPAHLHIADFTSVAITLVGCGGTGSHLASGLIALTSELGARSIGSDLLLVDPDRVEPKNVGRQLFSSGDVGKFKADALAQRLMNAFGARVGAACRAIDERDSFRHSNSLNLVIGAVDNPAARALLARQVQCAAGDLWWLDCGNDNHSGQIALGNTASAKEMKGALALGMIDRLPAPHLVYPDLIKTPRSAKRAVSCAEATAAGEQGLMVNRMVAAWALALLHDFLIARDPKYFALAFDLDWAGTKAYTLDAPTLAAVTGLGEKELTVHGGKR